MRQLIHECCIKSEGFGTWDVQVQLPEAAEC